MKQASLRFLKEETPEASRMLYKSSRNHTGNAEGWQLCTFQRHQLQDNINSTRTDHLQCFLLGLPELLGQQEGNALQIWH